MRRTLTLGLALAATTCSLVTDLDGLGADGAVTDGSSELSPPDASEAGDAPTTSYHALADPSSWATYSTSALTPTATSFSGGAFDGRYVYFAPKPGSAIVRLDTTGTFASTAAWATFDPGPLSGGAWGFAGAVFDGRYVYFVPSNNGSGYYGVVVRYDTQASYTASASWEAFDANSLGVGARGFIGATFDGRYVYFVPHWHGTVARYDTQAAFGVASSWSSFDATTLNAAARGFAGGVFDGRYVYLVPNVDGSALPNGLVVRYDTQVAFASASSWATYDVASAKGFFGAGFDGRNLYLAPSPNSTVARYDTQSVFGAPGSWSTLDTTTIGAGAKSYGGCAFDGRFVYFVPGGGVVSRYDGAGTFGATQSWSTYSLATPDGGAGSWQGAVFDGRYLYFVPVSGPVARFDAVEPPSEPKLPGWFGSFY